MFIRHFNGVVIAAVILGLNGCTHLLNPVEDYLSADFDREVATLATDASKRLTVVRMAGRIPHHDDALRRGEFCSEPPPDAMIALANSWTATLKKISQVEANLHYQIAYSMGPLLSRSQGLQWSRDTLSYLCVAYMNRAITRNQYKNLIDDTMTAAKQLIMKEIDKFPESLKVFGSVLAPTLQQNAQSPPQEMPSSAPEGQATPPTNPSTNPSTD